MPRCVQTLQLIRRVQRLTEATVAQRKAAAAGQAAAPAADAALRAGQLLADKLLAVASMQVGGAGVCHGVRGGGGGGSFVV
jgi:hypothetical protein